MYARWVANHYTVFYQPNGGQGTMTPQSDRYDQDFCLSPNLFERTGYTFAGWNTDSSGQGGRAFAEGQQVRNLAGKNGSNDRITLYAQWQPVNYTVLFDPNGGQGAIAGMPAVYDRPLALPGEGFTKEDAVLAGWSLIGGEGNSRDFLPGQQVQNLAAGEGETVTLYAVWLPHREIQQFYLDQLEEFCALYPDRDYYPEDAEGRTEAYEQAKAEIQGAGASEAAMRQAVQQAARTLQELPTKSDRAEEIARG